MADEKDSKKVKVKMLRQVGPHQAGDEVELDEALAEELCKPSIQQVGNDSQNLQKAVRVEDFEKLKDSLDVSMLTQAEMDQLGRKNVIPSPYDTHTMKTAGEVTKQLEEAQVNSEAQGEAPAAPRAPTAPSTQPPVEPKKVDPIAPSVDNADKGKAKKK